MFIPEIVADEEEKVNELTDVSFEEDGECLVQCETEIVLVLVVSLNITVFWYHFIVPPQSPILEFKVFMEAANHLPESESELGQDNLGIGGVFLLSQFILNSGESTEDNVKFLFGDVLVLVILSD